VITSLLCASWRSSTLGPFKHRLFLAIWTASLVSSFGTLIQVVGASWLMTLLAPSPQMVALVQAAMTAPIMLLSLAGGASADIWDRRIVMLAAQVMMLAVSIVLTVLAYLGKITPYSLLFFTFLLGVGTALYAPAWQSSVGEQVPRAELSAAVSLNSVAYNLARTLGPAIGGVLVATAGAPAAFLTNTLSYVGLITVLATWRRPRPVRTLPPESILAAMGSGVRYARLSPGIRTVLIRGMVFGFLGSPIWALLPLVARDLVGGGARTYGLLFGALGAGAVLGALGSASARRRHPNERVVRLASLGFGAATILTGASSWHALTMLALLVTGACWVAILSTFNFTVQVSSPRWVVGRTVAIYQMVTFGGLAIGSWLWGVAAGHLGLEATFVVAGALMSASALLGSRFPLPQPEGLNLDPSRSTLAGQEALTARGVDAGPVVVTVEYRIALVDAARFVSAMGELRRIRRRDGARRWTLLQDAADPQAWIERYHTPNWVEHLRRHHRFTVADLEIERRVLAFHRGARPPVIRHLLERPAQRSSAPPSEWLHHREHHDRDQEERRNLVEDPVPALRAGAPAIAQPLHQREAPEVVAHEQHDQGQLGMQPAHREIAGGDGDH
jgi:MFS family permease